MNETAEHRSWTMSKVKSSDTKPEMIIRRLVHSLGYRYRLHARTLPGKPDMVFAARKKVIFIHGCFWHGHAELSCKLARMPKTRQDYWAPKIAGNRDRYNRQVVTLEAAGWRVLTVWECQMKDMELVKSTIVGFLS